MMLPNTGIAITWCAEYCLRLVFPQQRVLGVQGTAALRMRPSFVLFLLVRDISLGPFPLLRR